MANSMEAKFIYVGIRVKDLDESIKFYSEVLGMKVKGRSRIEDTKGDVVGLVSADGKLELELNHYDRDSPYFTKYVAGEGLDHIAFAVDDLDATLAQLKRKGHPAVSVVKTKSSKWAYIADPNGIWIELCQA